jgi:xanthine/uracil/vitamin C permease (AzgA family)
MLLHAAPLADGSVSKAPEQYVVSHNPAASYPL